MEPLEVNQVEVNNSHVAIRLNNKRVVCVERNCIMIVSGAARCGKSRIQAFEIVVGDVLFQYEREARGGSCSSITTK